MEFHIGSQAPKVPSKIIISHVFVISGGNILWDKAQEIFHFSFPGRIPVIFHRISEGLWNSFLTEEIFNIKNWKKRFIWFFLQYYEPADLGKEIFTTWDVLKSEVYLTCTNFWKIPDDLKECIKVIRFPSWPKNKKFSVKMHFFTFLTPWKIRFWINNKFGI